ncbi:hypothetical protein LCGC14_2793480, partial [marine sediment metagenome]
MSERRLSPAAVLVVLSLAGAGYCRHASADEGTEAAFSMKPVVARQNGEVTIRFSVTRPTDVAVWIMKQG